MMPIGDDSTSAAARSAAARQRLSRTLGDLQARLSPKALARDAVQELKETSQELAQEGVAAAKRHPLTIGGAAAGIILFLLRRPIGSFLRGAGNATAASVTSLNHNRAARRTRKPASKRTPT